MPDRRTPYDIGELLERIESSAHSAHLEAQAANVAAQQANVELKRLNGTVARLSQYVEGTEADRDAGLLHKVRDLRTQVFDLRSVRNEGAAILRLGKWVIATMLAAVAVLVALSTLLLRVAGVL